MDGMEVLKQVRAWSSVPVIVVSARTHEGDKVAALDLGADDYLTKPFGMMEMVSRVNAVLRRCGASDEKNVLKAGGLVLDDAARTVTVDGEKTDLTYKEFEILRLFLSHPENVFSRDRLFSEVWGENYIGESRTVDMHIRTLRQKLGKYGENIKTVRNVGYKMEVPKE